MRTKLFILLIIVFCSCGRKSTNETGNTGSVISIDLLSEPGLTVKKLSEIAENVQYIPLQTTAGSLMDRIIRKIVYRDNRIYISSGQEIMCFGVDGKFLFKIEKSGRGPEEYTYLLDFDISSDNRFLTLLSSSKLLIYGISENGFTFRRSIRLKDPAPLLVSIVPETENILLSIAPFTGTEPTLSLLINASGDSIHFKPNCYKYKMAREHNYQALNEMIAYSVKDYACFKEEFSDTVFCVNTRDSSFKPRIIFNTHGTLTTPAIRAGLEQVRNNSTFIAYIFETDRYVFYKYFTMQAQNALLFDKKTNAKHLLYKQDLQSDQKNSLKDDLSGGPDFNIEFLRSYCSGGKLFSFAEALALKNYIGSADFERTQAIDPKKKSELKKNADSLKETDNPVLIMITLKK